MNDPDVGPRRQRPCQENGIEEIDSNRAIYTPIETGKLNGILPA